MAYFSDERDAFQLIGANGGRLSSARLAHFLPTGPSHQGILRSFRCRRGLARRASLLLVRFLRLSLPVVS